MKTALKFLFIVMIVAGAASCRRSGMPSHDTTVAKVGDKRLTVRELVSLFPETVTPQDSLKLLESYVDMWVKKQLKVQEAERLFSGSERDIERMVEDYRNSLLTIKLDQHHIDKRLDTLYDQTTIEEYYEAHKADFVLDRPIIKGLMVTLPYNFRQKAQLKDLMIGSGDKYQDFLDISIKNSLQLTEFTAWTDMDDVMTMLPASARARENDSFAVGKVEEFRDGDSLTYLLVRERRTVGDPIPLERVSDAIGRTLVSQRKQEIIRTYEDSLYRASLAAGEVEITIY